MRNGFVIVALAGAALAAVPDTTEAAGRRRHRPVPCPPVVICPPAPWCCPTMPHPPWGYGAPGGVPGAPWVTGPFAPAVMPDPAQAAVPTVLTIKGRQYRIIPDPGPLDYRPDAVEPPDQDIPFAKKANIPTKDKFSGTSRRVAKTTIFNGPVETFATVGELIDSLTDYQTMIDKNIDNTPTTARVPEERRNVKVSAFIYAYKKEGDKDYHVILGDAPGTPNQRYLNVEVSGIPIAGTDENRDRLWAVRKAFEAEFNPSGSWSGGYRRPEPPVPVRITGSLFWDVDHQHPPFVGPQSHKPKTPWEIHPISDIEFLAN